ncbi:uncharacterized protein LOC125881258 [Epinephelus fuscoguttatus]|uniref:uncharacterized protein LOC125881258 n=1 Tax=Epinephelus fuscoguttatus TaxID=293821 RepID=UPI0020D1298D|nr:uncharacterized protein LOC125881258 [Epinephelus fuscoguttatus]
MTDNYFRYPATCFRFNATAHTACRASTKATVELWINKHHNSYFIGDMGSGSTCAVVGCHNNSKKLKILSETVCFEHQKLRKTCPCPAPYALHTMPSKEERRLAWLAALKRKYPPKKVYVCSFHFVDKKPTDLHPDPELYLGYDRPPPKKRRKLVRGRATETARQQQQQQQQYGPDCTPDFSSTASDQTRSSSPAHPPEPKMHSVHTQWVDPARQDHDYCQTASRKDMQDKMTQCDEIGYFLLQNDADALLYTGISLETFNILVSALEGYANNSFTMSVRDQVLMTLMKLKTNRVVGDLSRQFHVSLSMASKIISYWIDKLEEVLRPLIPWLPKETIRATMPAAFKSNFLIQHALWTAVKASYRNPKILIQEGNHTAIIIHITQ